LAASPLGAIKSRVRTLTERVRLSEGRSSSLEPAKSAVRWKVRQRNQGSQSELGGSGQPTLKRSCERPVHSSSMSSARPDRPGRSEGRTTEGNRTSCSSSRPSDWRVRDPPDDRGEPYKLLVKPPKRLARSRRTGRPRGTVQAARQATQATGTFAMPGPNGDTRGR